MNAHSSLESLGVDIRAERRGDSALYLREDLAQHVVGVLQSGTNVLLRGESGSGKTNLVRSLVIAEWQTSRPQEQLELLSTRKITAPMIIETHGAKFIEGCEFCHDLENKMAFVLNKAIEQPAIVFIDPLDSIVGIGASTVDPNTDVANLLIPYLEKGLRVIGSVTPEGEQRIRRANPRLFSRFVTVDVPHPDDFEALTIAKLRLDWLAGRGNRVDGNAAEAGLRLARRYMPGTPQLVAFTTIVRSAAASKEIDESSMRLALAEVLGVQPGYVGASAAATYEETERALSGEVYGQPEAVREVADALCRYSVGMAPAGKPIAAFLAAGPTGCGKTSLALAAAKQLTGSQDSIVRVDMAEYSDPMSTTRLLSADPRSVHSQLLSRPAGVLLLDEVEKADPTVLLAFLGALGEGRLTGATGKTARLDHYVVFLTTNVGGRRWSAGLPDGKVRELVLSDLSSLFSPEFRARMTRVLLFQPLSAAAGSAIVLRELEALNSMPGLVDRELQLIWPGLLPEVLSEWGVSVERGARGVAAVVRSLVTTSVARWLTEHPEAAQGTVMLAPRVESGQLVSLSIDWVDDGGFFVGLPN